MTNYVIFGEIESLATVAQRKEVVAAPHFTKKYVVVDVGKLGGKIAELLPSGSPNNLLCLIVFYLI